jgi:hypothetical protein
MTCFFNYSYQQSPVVLIELVDELLPRSPIDPDALFGVELLSHIFLPDGSPDRADIIQRLAQLLSCMTKVGMLIQTDDHLTEHRSIIYTSVTDSCTRKHISWVLFAFIFMIFSRICFKPVGFSFHRKIPESNNLFHERQIFLASSVRSFSHLASSTSTSSVFPIFINLKQYFK